MPADKRQKSSFSARIGGWLFKALLAFIILSILWVLLYKLVLPPVTATMLADAPERGIAKDWTPLDRIDPDMARAVIAGEDAKFCEHRGFDSDAIADAWSRYREGGRIRGGSTISQQTAKNAFLWQGGGFFRKGLEAWFKLLIEQIWGKRRIMEVYLNVAETGIGTYGAEAGSRRYFDHGADRMTATEAARIAAVLPLPKKRGAIAPTGFTRRYGNSILARMGVVRREGLDDCLDLAPAGRDEEPDRKARPKRSRDPDAALEAVVPPPDPLPVEPVAEAEPVVEAEPIGDITPEPEVEVEPEPAPEPTEEPVPQLEEPPST